MEQHKNQAASKQDWKNGSKSMEKVSAMEVAGVASLSMRKP